MGQFAVKPYICNVSLLRAGSHPTHTSCCDAVTISLHSLAGWSLRILSLSISLQSRRRPLQAKSEASTPDLQSILHSVPLLR